MLSNTFIIGLTSLTDASAVSIRMIFLKLSISTLRYLILSLQDWQGYDEGIRSVVKNDFLEIKHITVISNTFIVGLTNLKASSLAFTNADVVIAENLRKFHFKYFIIVKKQ